MRFAPVLIALFFVPALMGQDFIPYEMKHSQKEYQFYASKLIVSERITQYFTGKNFIPDSKPVDRKIFNYSPEGKLVAATIIDSTGERIDSFFYYVKGNFRKISSYTKGSSGFIKKNTLHFINETGKSPAEVLVFNPSPEAGPPVSTWHYNYSDYGKKVTILSINLSDSTVKDTVYLEYDNAGRKTKKIYHKETSEFKYDASGNLIEEKIVTPAGTTTSKYTLNSAGRPIKIAKSSPGQNSTSEMLYSMKGILILTKTKIDTGKNSPEKYHLEIREIGF